jgi:probable F420-dependent oxidoreductase
MPSLVVGRSSLDDLVASARLAEEAGFESIWATEFYDHSATVGIAAMATGTTKIGLGSAIAYAFGRTPLVLAAEARDLDELSGGRVTIGLGTGTQRMQRDWHGLDGEHAATRMEELVPLVRKLWKLNEGPVEHEGRFYNVSIQPTAPPLPVEREIPIYMAGVNEPMIQAAGAVADGLVGHPLFTRRYVEEVVRPALARGAKRAGRDAIMGPSGENVPIAGYINCSVSDDREAARREAATLIAFNATVSTYQAVIRLHGFEENAAAVRTAWESRDWEGMVGAISDEMIDTIALAGTPEEVRERFESDWAGLYETPLLWPPVFRGLDGVRDVVRAFTG